MRIPMALLALPVLMAIAGCSDTPTKDEAAGAGADGTSAASGYGSGNGPMGGTGLGGGAAGEKTYGPGDRMGDVFGRGFDDPGNPLSTRVIYFDFDRSELRAEDQRVLTAHANFLARNPRAAIILEGHTDERGSREYNLALGERRSQSVRQVLQLNGATTGQLEVVSYGEERPAATGHEESAWRLNRRVELVYRRQ